MDNRYIAGVSPNGITDKAQVKILICFLLDSFAEPLTREQIHTVLSKDDLVNYFIFEEAFGELIESTHITIREKEGEGARCTLNALGKETAVRLHNVLPKSVKDRVVSCMAGILDQIKAESENEVIISAYGNGYNVTMISHDTDYDLMKLELFAPDEESAKLIRKKFLADPSSVYSGVLSLFLE